MIVLDTDHISLLQHPESPEGQLLLRRLAASSDRDIATTDLKIAAVAMANHATLLSRNLVDFQRIPGLRVEDWTSR